MKIVIIIIIVVVILAAVALVFGMMMQGPELTAYEFLKEPRITNLTDRRVIEVTVKGPPQAMLKPAFSLLMQAYYKIKATPRGAAQSAPLLRCPLSGDGTEFTAEASESTASADWQGRVAMAVPDTVRQLPQLTNKQSLEIRLTTWEYGPVAEILHIGPYEAELPTIKRLEQFIKQQGYRITGEHEEEYLRGPGMLFSKPEKYYTIIRYRIEQIK